LFDVYRFAVPQTATDLGLTSVAARLLLLHFPNSVYMIIKITMVDKQPPPNFLAPQAAMIALKNLFILSFF
jgi:hypothetical protein